MQPLRSVRLEQAATTLLAPLEPAAPVWPRRLAFVGPVVLLTAVGTALAAYLTAGVADPLRLAADEADRGGQVAALDPVGHEAQDRGDA